MSRTEFSKKVRGEAFLRAAGHCEMCGARLTHGKFQFDHIVADSIGGTATLDNCQVLCSPCHGSKSAKIDTPRAAKTKRQYLKHNRLWPKSPHRIQSRGFPAGRNRAPLQG